MVWILQCLYHDQVGTVRGSSGTSRPFDIRQGVRQGCVLSPRLFACVLQRALRSWRARVEHYGLDFEDGMAPLLDLRFADESESESELAGPKAAPLERKQKQFKICRSSIMQGENYKIPLH